MQTARGPAAPAAPAVVTKAPWANQQAVNAVIPLSQPSMPLPVPADSALGRPAIKRIHAADDLRRCLESGGLQSFVAFILSLNESVQGKKSSDSCHVSGAVQRMLDVLKQLDAWVDETPPAPKEGLRYGNPAYRIWFARLTEQAQPLMQSILPDERRTFSTEIAPYFMESFGNATRIDYGTGHETNFCALLYCFARLGVYEEQDRQALVLHVFSKYIELMRKIQTTYWLEPAGSHGVWGLDDYQFLPFMWGASQLVAHPMIKPKSIHNPDVLEAYYLEYLYLACVKFVKQVKKGALSETSPILNDISCVPTWSKVNSGMIKMYQAEVLSKFPIMQHFLFCSLLPFTTEPAPAQQRQASQSEAAGSTADKLTPGSGQAGNATDSQA